MRTVVLSTIALLLVLVCTAAAADVSGKWVAQIPGRQGNMMEQTFTFKASGEQLTGTVSSQRGDQEITEGKISGNDISFMTVMSFGDMQIKQIYKGTVAGNEIKFSRTMQGGRGGGAPVEFVAKKSN
ncbi:MAG: hypothetical protein IT159_12075 [Bryobacterales bacterium]|nr:hypothetical protein [Bryobacterales bacterium]